MRSKKKERDAPELSPGGFELDHTAARTPTVTEPPPVVQVPAADPT